MISKIILFIFAFIVWILLAMPVDIQHFSTGLIVAFLVTFLTVDLFALEKPQYLLEIKRYLWFSCFVPLFIWLWFKASINMALIILSGESSIKPGVVKVKTGLRSDMGLTFLANSITLMPGTLCVDIKPENGILYVHWLNVESSQTEEATQLIVKKFENVLTKIFE